MNSGFENTIPPFMKFKFGVRRSITPTAHKIKSQQQIKTPVRMNDVNMVDVSMDAEKPTVEDAIRWYQQEAWRTGALGFRRDFGDLKDVFEDWNIESTPALDVQPTAGNAMSLWAAAQRLGANAASVEMRHRRRMRTVDGDTLLQEDVRYEVHRRLQAAGMHLQEINANTQKMKSMTLMTAYLWDIEHRAPNSDSQIKAMVCTNFRGTKSPTPIVLSTKNPFPELLASLKEFVIARAEMTGRPIAAGEDIEFLNAWRYKMTDCKDGKLGFIDSGWTRLAYDFHYQTMLKRYSGPGQRAMIPLLAPVLCFRKQPIYPPRC